LAYSSVFLMELETTNEQYHDLHVLLDKKRTGKTTVVPTQALRNLLMDHSRMCGVITKVGIKIENV